MKNLVFIFAVLLGSMLYACGGRTVTTIEPTVDSIEVVTDGIPTDSLVVDSVAVDTMAVDTIK